MSNLVLKTLREAPSDAEAISHQLLLRAGYIRRLASGVYSFLPLGYRVLRKVNQIVEEEFERAGAQQVLLPALQPVEIWEATGRLQTMAEVLMKVESKGGDFVLGPTHEEAVIQSISSELGTYKELPATVYQIQTKFRDETRPRFGLLRTKEFIMADGYSFDEDQDGMRTSYQKMYDAYIRIFERCGIEFFPVEADAGAIGGEVNHEFMAPSAIGEDHFASCESCGYAANVETARSHERTIEHGDLSLAEMRVHVTPDAPGVEAAVKAISDQGVELRPDAMLKCIASISSGGQIVLLLVPGDREARLPAGLTLMTDLDFERFPFLRKGYIGPMKMSEHGVRIVADYSVSERQWWATGANVTGSHVSGAVLGRDFFVDQWDSVSVVRDGDPCPRCSHELSLVRSVEVGHTFQLGLTYSSKIPSASFVGADGATHPFWMGCYGIGMTRLPAVIVEYFADAAGIRWPKEIAPYKIGIVSIGASRSETVRSESERLYQELSGKGMEVLYDDRDLGPGVKFADAELIGTPFVLVVGQRGLDSGRLEIRDRMGGTTTEVSLNDVVKYLDSV